MALPFIADIVVAQQAKGMGFQPSQKEADALRWLNNPTNTTSEERAIIQLFINHLQRSTRYPWPNPDKWTIERLRVAANWTYGETRPTSLQRGIYPHTGYAVDFGGSYADLPRLFEVWQKLGWEKGGNIGVAIGIPPADIHLHVSLTGGGQRIEISRPPNVVSIDKSDYRWKASEKKAREIYLASAPKPTKIPINRPDNTALIMGGIVGAAVGYSKDNGQRDWLKLGIYTAAGVVGGMLLQVARKKLEQVEQGLENVAEQIDELTPW